MTSSRPDPYDDALSAIRNHVDDLGVWLAIWSASDGSQPDAHSRRCAGDAVKAIDGMLGHLYGVRGRLVRRSGPAKTPARRGPASAYKGLRSRRRR